MIILLKTLMCHVFIESFFECFKPLSKSQKDHQNNLSLCVLQIVWLSGNRDRLLFLGLISQIECSLPPETSGSEL